MKIRLVPVTIDRIEPGGVYKHEILCDRCDQPIENLTLGVAVWRRTEDQIHPWIVHKGRCDDLFRGGPTVNDQSEELIILLGRIAQVADGVLMKELAI